MATIPRHQWNPGAWSDLHRAKVIAGRRRLIERQRAAKRVLLGKMYELYQFKGVRFFRIGEHPDNARALGLNYWTYRQALAALMKLYPDLLYARVKGRKLKPLRTPPGQWKTPMTPSRIKRMAQAKKRQVSDPLANAAAGSLLRLFRPAGQNSQSG
jgi:hypothetical protein